MDGLNLKKAYNVATVQACCKNLHGAIFIAEKVPHKPLRAALGRVRTRSLTHCHCSHSLQFGPAASSTTTKL